MCGVIGMFATLSAGAAGVAKRALRPTSSAFHVAYLRSPRMRLRRRVNPVAAIAPVAIAVVVIIIARAFASPDQIRALRTVPQVAGSAATHSKWLRGAETSYDRARAWWDPQRGWYLKFLPGSRNHADRLVTLWHVVHLFDATNAIAIADPTPANVAAARAFANAAERYWN